MKGDSASVDMSRDIRVLQNQGLVRGIAASVWHMAGECVILEDLISYGQVGLIEAIDRFRPETGYRFSTFAYYRIRGAVLDGLCKLRGLSRRTAEKARFSRGFQELHIQRSGDGDPASQEIEQLWGSLQESLRDGVVLFMLSHMSTEFDGGIEESSESSILAREWTEQMNRAVEQLPRPEADLVRLVYFQGLSLSEVAAQLGVSRSWACRLHQRAIHLLRLSIERYMNPPLNSTTLR